MPEGFAITLRLVRGHPLLGRPLATEPETILPLLTVGAEPCLAAHVGDAEVAETFVRVVLSFVLVPGGAIPLLNDDDAHA
ncbi:hypothetical protein SAMN05444920_108189 [Nonomuraea solani]|uniref:Uncharacterized protein n=1 Tax=Nonomuraea solani TaxID=1144553 RepID=A0A1H6E9K1_9ACTN|nr:hypothetical protein [Nonomuraea solani]SEG93779.1 hypothetical protein SAMN05444920_108189 [Nonomuraea solani]